MEGPDPPVDPSSPGGHPTTQTKPGSRPPALLHASHTAFIDMRTNYDEVLMRRFYAEMMLPNFPDPDQLDSLQYMRAMVQSAGEDPATREMQFMDYHILIMLRFDEPYDRQRKYDYAPESFAGEMVGGVVFEYYIQANAGLLTYLLVSPTWRGLNLGSALAAKCREMMEAHAKRRGHLAGCNAIFLETNSALKVSASDDVMSPTKRHEIFYKMGLRLVDFDYVQAPLAKDKQKVNYLLLCCFISPRIPCFSGVGPRDAPTHYLPSTLLRNTIQAFWSNAPIKGRRFTEDVDYKRMQDQLRRRDHIALLGLPWERPFTVVDLREHFDIELLVQFYQDLLVPCYQGHDGEIDSLDRWLELLSPKGWSALTEAANTVVFHLLLALKYSEDENSRPAISGGLSFEYFPHNNCGLLTYLLVPMGQRGARMARALIDRALSELDRDAKARGLLGGCNVIFMECAQMGGPGGGGAPVAAVAAVAAPNDMAADPPQDRIQDFEQQHALLESMGWKMLDFDYVQPPNEDPTKKSMSMFLIALVTPRIPTLLQEDARHLYIPTSTLSRFLVDLWEQACSRLGVNYTADPDFVNMIARIQKRSHIPLLSRPWNKSWTMVDLLEGGAAGMLGEVHRDLLVPAFGADSQLLPALEHWNAHLVASADLAALQVSHVLLAFSQGLSATPALAAIAFTYFARTNCGMVSHAVVRDRQDLAAVAKSLFERVASILDQDAVARGNLAGCNAIFLETADPTAGGRSGPIPTPPTTTSIGPELREPPPPLDISLQHELLYNLGWLFVDFGYAPPPGRRNRLPRALAVLLTGRIPKATSLTEDDSYYYLPRPMLTSFIGDVWRAASADPSSEALKDAPYLGMMDMLSRRDRVQLLELPWVRPWTLLDLWEDFDAQLLYKFYQNFYAIAFPNRHHREPLSTWLRLLSAVRDVDGPPTASIEDFHVLVALRAGGGGGGDHYVSPRSAVLGGLTFSYLVANNCGLLTFLSAPQGPRRDLLIRNFFEEATINLNENAARRGHIAGCNAIFMDAAAGERFDPDGLQRDGWRALDFDYARPHGADPAKLLVLLTPNVPRGSSLAHGTRAHYIPSEMLASVIESIWRVAYQRMGDPKPGFQCNAAFQRMINELASGEIVRLLEIGGVKDSRG